MDDLINGISDVIGRYRLKKGISFLYLKWVLLAASIVYLYAIKDSRADGHTKYALLAAVLLYNVLSALWLFNPKTGIHKKLRVIAYIDIIEISLLCSQTGGAGSDIYLMYFFVIGSLGIYDSAIQTLAAGYLSVFAYIITSIYFYNGMNVNDYWKLGIKSIYILVASFAFLKVNREIRKYEELHKREFKLARTDKLTGLANRRYFEQKLTEEAEYSDISGMPINILIFDIDNFKKFNDTYGHVWGDKLLELFADIIKMNIRKSDIPIRYGGEEFLILIRDLDKRTARNVAERIRTQLEKQCICLIGSASGDMNKVTVSCGVSQYPSDSGNIREAVEFSDMALYKAKRAGKNKVVCYDEIDK